MFGLGFGELLVIAVIALIFIGPKKLPELAKGLGQGMREFQNASKGLTDQIAQEVAAESKTVGKQVEIVETTASPAETEAKTETHS
jgi:sec-independent protein translocase protein TatA